MTVVDELTYGYVRGKFSLLVGDDTDGDALPDRVPAIGKVRFTPAVNLIKEVGADPGFVLPQQVIFETNAAGRLVDTSGNEGVWLATGVWNVSFSFAGASIPGFPIQVTTDHTEQTPLYLVLHSPYEEPSPYTVFVVNEQIYVDTIAARDAAQAAQLEAETAVADAFENVTSAHIVCTSTTRPGHMAGLRIFETDTNRSYVSNGTEWIEIGSAAASTATVTTSTTRPAHVVGLRIFETDTGRSFVSDGAVWIELADTGDVATVQAAADAAQADAVAAQADADDALTRAFKIGRPGEVTPTWWGAFTADNAPTVAEGANVGDLGVLLP